MYRDVHICSVRLGIFPDWNPGEENLKFMLSRVYMPCIPAHMRYAPAYNPTFWLVCPVLGLHILHLGLYAL